MTPDPSLAVALTAADQTVAQVTGKRRTTGEIEADLRKLVQWYHPRGAEAADQIEQAADRLGELDAEVAKLRAEVGDVTRQFKNHRDSQREWIDGFKNRERHLKANIADEEAYIATLKAIVDGCPRCSARAALRAEDL